MKRRLLSLLALLVLTSGTTWAQETSANEVPEPQDLGVLLHLQNQTFVPLELQSAVKQDRTSFFASTSEEFLVVPGAKSSIRFKVNTPIVFYLRVFLDESDPRAGFFPLRDPTKFKLVELKADKEQRKMTLVKSGFTYTKRQVGRPLLVRLYGEHCFQLSPSEALEPGEYAVKYLRESEDSDEEGQFDLFCFGVDR